MELLEFPHILPYILIMNIAENTVSFRLFKIETGDRRFLHRGYPAGKTGVHNMYPAES